MKSSLMACWTEPQIDLPEIALNCSCSGVPAGVEPTKPRLPVLYRCQRYVKLAQAAVDRHLAAVVADADAAREKHLEQRAVVYGRLRQGTSLASARIAPDAISRWVTQPARLISPLP